MKILSRNEEARRLRRPASPHARGLAGGRRRRRRQLRQLSRALALKALSAELLDPSSPSTALPPASTAAGGGARPTRASTMLPSPVAPPPPVAALAAERKPSLPFRSSSSPGARRLAGDGKQSLLSPSEARSDGAAPRPKTARAPDHAEDVGVLPGPHARGQPPRAVAARRDPGGAHDLRAARQQAQARPDPEGQRDAPAAQRRALRRVRHVERRGRGGGDDRRLRVRDTDVRHSARSTCRDWRRRRGRELRSRRRRTSSRSCIRSRRTTGAATRRK